MKFLFAIKTLAHGHGGAEKILCQITGELAARGHEVSILTFDNPKDKTFYPVSDAVKRLYLPSGKAGERTSFKDMRKLLKPLRKKIKAEKPDVVIGFMHSMFVPLAFALAGSNIPVIASEHIVPEYYKTRGREFFALKLAARFVKKMTVISDQVAALYPKTLQPKIVAIPNPVEFPKTKRRSKKDDPRKVILNVGRLDPQKNQAFLVAAFASLATDFPDWDLKIIGEGDLRKPLEQQVEELGLTERVILPGVTKNIAREYRAADVFAFPSSYESFGLALAEAMAFGLPCIGLKDCPGVNELIQDGANGVLTVPDYFARNLQNLMENEDKRAELGNAARQSVEQYSLEAIIDRWEALLTRPDGNSGLPG